MSRVGMLLTTVVQLFILAMIVRAVMSWFPSQYGGPAYRLGAALDRVINPVLAPLRRLIPPVRLGGAYLDLSFLVLILLLEFIVLPLLHRL